MGSYKKKLQEHPEKERQLWSIFSHEPFEKGIAKEKIKGSDLIEYLDYHKYYELTNQKNPTKLASIVNRLELEKFIVKRLDNCYDITNLGAILFAKDLSLFDRLYRKAIRLIMYEGQGRTKTIREIEGKKGYAIGFNGLINYINIMLPQREEINTLRTIISTYPEIAIRELVANAMIHQNFEITGTSILIEIFSDRIEITNPGTPLIEPIRFIDSPPRSRNENLAAFMRRIKICEERGSGIDKVIESIETFHLPGPLFVVTENHTKVTLFNNKNLATLDRKSKIRTCYQHACLKFVNNDYMTLDSLQQRFNIPIDNRALITQIITYSLEDNLIKLYHNDDPQDNHLKYLPFWA